MLSSASEDLKRKSFSVNSLTAALCRLILICDDFFMGIIKKLFSEFIPKNLKNQNH